MSLAHFGQFLSFCPFCALFELSFLHMPKDLMGKEKQFF